MITTWTQDRVDELLKRWALGYTAPAIGCILGVSKSTVQRKALSLGLMRQENQHRDRDRDIVAAYKLNLSMNHIALTFGLSGSGVRAILQRDAPEIIRDRHAPEVRTRIVAIAASRCSNGFALADLGLRAAGPCSDCGTEIVSYSREIEQWCGFCAAPACWFGKRRAA